MPVINGYLGRKGLDVSADFALLTWNLGFCPHTDVSANVRSNEVVRDMLDKITHSRMRYGL